MVCDVPPSERGKTRVWKSSKSILRSPGPTEQLRSRSAVLQGNDINFLRRENAWNISYNLVYNKEYQQTNAEILQKPRLKRDFSILDLKTTLHKEAPTVHSPTGYWVKVV